MNNNEYLVAVEGSLEGGMFSSERVFEITLADGTSHIGIAPRFFCWDKDNNLVTETSAIENEPGLIAAKFVDELDEDQVAVEVPDGEVIAVWKSQVKDRPTEIVPPTPRSKQA